MFVSPFNKQCIELRKEGYYDAVTVNKFVGKGISDVEMAGRYDWSDKSVIVFDEVLLNNIHFLFMIEEFVREHGDEVKVLANGDVNQLKPINFWVNNVEDAITMSYRMDCVPEVKRLKHEKDKENIRRIKKQSSREFQSNRYDL